MPEWHFSTTRGGNNNARHSMTGQLRLHTMATRDTVKSGAELARQHTRLQARKHNERHWSEGIESDDRYGEDLEVVRPRTKRVEQRPPRPAWWYRWLVG